MDPLQVGKGNWAAFPVLLDNIYEAAAEWRQALAGVDRPWLCWNVSDRWCTLQQRLIQEVGWTPVIGFDPRCRPPKTVLPGSVVIDFNAKFGFPVMYPHFALEFAFLFADRLAFWHSDLLCRIEVMQKLKAMFEGLQDGAMAAVPDFGSRRYIYRYRHHRYWELAGCTTRGASKSQFDQGAGWWRLFDYHHNCPNEQERHRRSKYYYDHGVGIMYWKRRYGGHVVDVPLKWVAEGHCTSINRKNYQRVQPSGQQDLPTEIDLNFDIVKVAQQLDIGHLL